MMPTPVAPFNPEEFERTVQALREGTSAADSPSRPPFDPYQARQVAAEAVHGRRIEDYRRALERAGFTYWPAGMIPPGCEGNPLEPPRPLTVGQWRRPADGKIPKRLALTDDQITAWFHGPEELWRWLTDMANAQKIRQAKLEQQRRVRVTVPR